MPLVHPAPKFTITEFPEGVTVAFPVIVHKYPVAAVTGGQENVALVLGQYVVKPAVEGLTDAGTPTVPLTH